MADGPDANSTPHGEGPSGKPLPLSVRLLAAGVRGARDVGKATGIDQAIEAAAEEAMVAAVESEAVERAIARVLKGPVVEEAMNSALESDAVKNALVEALDSELVDEVWRRLLASDEAQRLVERIAEAPEIRAAISAQSVGMIEDVGHTIGNGTRRLDSVVERVARRIFFRKRRSEPTDRAGAVTRGLAFALDVLIVNLGFSGLAAVAALIASAFTGNGDGVSNFALAAGTALWFAIGSLYLVGFWSLAGQTPGMRFLGIRLDVESPRPAPRQGGQAPDRDGAGGDGLRARLPRHPLRQAPPRLGRPAQRRRRRLRGQRAHAGALVAPRDRRAAARNRPRHDEGPGFPGPSVTACGRLFA